MTHASMPITAKNAYGTLRGVGYSRPFIERMLPEWWDNSLLATSAGAAQFALILRQKLGLSVNFDREGLLDVELGAPNARFKRRIDTPENELSMAASMGVAMAQLAAYCTKNPYRPLPTSAQNLHAAVIRNSSATFLTFQALVDFCWESGIPVLFLDDLPAKAKRMAGMAVIENGRPVVILGFRHHHCARQLFILAHELGHVASGHLPGGGVLIDEHIFEVSDGLGNAPYKKDAEENEADEYAIAAIRNTNSDPLEALGNHFSGASLAMKALEVGESCNIDPEHLIVSFAHRHNRWPVANQALQFFPSSRQAMQILAESFFANIELSALSEENREHLIAAQGYDS